MLLKDLKVRDANSIPTAPTKNPVILLPLRCSTYQDAYTSESFVLGSSTTLRTVVACFMPILESRDPEMEMDERPLNVW